jgi:hypothetical protein
LLFLSSSTIKILSRNAYFKKNNTLSRHSRAGGNPNSKTLNNQRRYNRFYQTFFIINYFVFLSLSFVEKKVTQRNNPHKVDTAPTGYPPVLIYSRELRDFSTLGQVLALFP